MRNSIYLLLLLTFLQSCEKKSQENPCGDFTLEIPTLNDSLDYNIIKTILKYDNPNADFLHLDQRISMNSVTIGIDGIKTRLDYENVDYDLSMLSCYQAKNEYNYFLSDSAMTNIAHLINQKEIDCLFSDQSIGWRNYYKKYPESKGIYSFSRPGINSSNDRAIIEYNWAQDYLLGIWYIVVLDKVNGKWTVMHRFITLNA